MRLHVFNCIRHPHMHVIPFSVSIFIHLIFRFHSHDTITQNALRVIAFKRSDFDQKSYFEKTKRCHFRFPCTLTSSFFQKWLYNSLSHLHCFTSIFSYIFALTWISTCFHTCFHLITYFTCYPSFASAYTRKVYLSFAFASHFTLHLPLHFAFTCNPFFVQWHLESPSHFLKISNLHLHAFPCAKHFTSKKKERKKRELKVVMESCSECTFEHRQKGFQSVKDSSLCWSTKENSRQLEREKMDHIKFPHDNGQFIKES